MVGVEKGVAAFIWIALDFWLIGERIYFSLVRGKEVVLGLVGEEGNGRGKG